MYPKVREKGKLLSWTQHNGHSLILWSERGQRSVRARHPHVPETDGLVKEAREGGYSSFAPVILLLAPVKIVCSCQIHSARE